MKSITDNFSINYIMLPIRSWSKTKWCKPTDPQNSKALLVYTSRRQPSNRSQIKYQDYSNLTIDRQSVPNSRVAENKKKDTILTLSQRQQYIYHVNPQKKGNDRKKQGKQCSTKINVSSSSLIGTPKAPRVLNYEKKVLSATKKQSTKNKVTGKSKKSINNKKPVPKQSRKSCKSSVKVGYDTEDEIKKKRKRCQSVQLKFYNDETLQKSYLMRQATEFEQKQNETARLGKAQNSIEKITENQEIYMQKMADSSQTIKKQTQRYQQEAIKQLTITNCKLQEQILNLYKKSETAIEHHNQQLLQIQKISSDKFQVVSQSNNQIRYQLKFLQQSYQALQQQKQAQQARLNEEITRQSNLWSEQRLQLEESISKTEEKLRKYMELAANLEKQNEKLQGQARCMGLQKQKLEKIIKKYEIEVKQLEGKIHSQIKRSREQMIQLDTLRKQKAYIKGSSELVLEVVRQELREIKVGNRGKDEDLNPVEGQKMKRRATLEQIFQ